MKFIDEIAGPLGVLVLLAAASLAAAALVTGTLMGGAHLWSLVRPRVTRTHRYVAAAALVVALMGAATVASVAWMSAPAPAAPAPAAPTPQPETPDPNAPEYRELPNGRWELCITKELLTDGGDYECTRWMPTVPPGGPAQPQHERPTVDPDAVTT